MPVPETNPAQVHFGAFELDLQTLQLKKRGHRLKLGPQPVKVLTLLAARPGELVTREELQQAVWGQDTFIDFEQGLNFCVRQLRAALDDEADSPRYIETVPRRGYRFIGNIVQNGNGGKAKTADSHPQVNPARQLEVPSAMPDPSPEHLAVSRQWLWVAFSGALVLASLLGLYVFRTMRFGAARSTGKPSLPFSVNERVLTANSSENPIAGAAVSGDGKYLAYADVTGLYVKPIATSGEAHRLTLPECPAPEMNSWFPDGTRLAITCRNEVTQQPSVWTVSVFGGSARKLIDEGAAASVSQDGSHIAFLRKELGRELWVMRADGSDVSRVIAEQPLVRISSPVWSPDGESIAYFKMVWAYLNPARSLEIVSKTGKSKPLLTDNQLNEALCWPSSHHLLYSTTEEVPNERRSTIWELEVQDGNRAANPKPIAQRAGMTTSISATQDEKLAVFTQMDWQEQVFIATLSPDGKRLLSHKRLTLDENVNIPFAWTPDGHSVLFSSNRGGRLSIFRQAIDQPTAEIQVSQDELVHIPRLSPDGSEILYLSVPQKGSSRTEPSINAVSFAGGAPRLILQSSGITNLQCAKAPSKVCLYSAVHGSDFVISSFDSHSGTHAELHRLKVGSGNINWSLSPDGSTLAIIPQAPGKARIELFSVGAHSIRELPIEGWTALLCVDWAADGKSLFTTTVDPQGGNSLLRVWPNGRTSVLLNKVHGQADWAIPAPNGRSLAIAENSDTSNAFAVDLPSVR